MAKKQTSFADKAAKLGKEAEAVYVKYVKSVKSEKTGQYRFNEQMVRTSKSESIDAETIRAVVVLSQMNLHIWHNESNYRKGIKDGNNLELTHGLNGIRNTAKNKIQELAGGRKDYKIDCLAAEFKDWDISW